MPYPFAICQKRFPRAAGVWLIIRAYVALLGAGAQLARGGFPAVHDNVCNALVAGHHLIAWTDAEICHAVDRACVFYGKEVRCLQRSAAAAVLLRKAGFRAELVVGVQTCPFRAHAWVEIAGRVVNDKPYVPTLYAVLDRC